MIAIICVDQKNGRLFNHRRQSQDREVRKDILQMIHDTRLWMDAYSYRQFKEEETEGKSIVVAEEFDSCVKEGEYVFFERGDFSENAVEKIIIYRWDKVYPADIYLDISAERWIQKKKKEFCGYSHEIITKEVYLKDEK